MPGVVYALINTATHEHAKSIAIQLFLMQTCLF